MRRMLGRSVAVMALVLGGVQGGIWSTTAQATVWDPHVHVSGHIDCSNLLQAPEWMRWEASNGEKGVASVSDWTSVSRAVRRGPIGLVKIQTFHLDLYSVPRSGTTVKFVVGCKDAIGQSEFKGAFGVKRPSVGVNVTRHLCGQRRMFRCVF